MDQSRSRARQLRKNPTDAERLLWQKLRFWQVDGRKLRRQQPLGGYIVDFVCLERRLIVELDAANTPIAMLTTRSGMIGCGIKDSLSYDFGITTY
jgi:very-short-patch-repair endonuclease